MCFLKDPAPRPWEKSLKRDFQNSNSFAKMQPTHWALIPASAQHPPLELQPDCSHCTKTPRIPAKNSAVSDAKASLEFYYVTHLVREDLNAFFLLCLQNSVISRGFFCLGASPAVGASQRGDSSTWGKVPRADTHGDNLIKQDWQPL